MKVKALKALIADLHDDAGVFYSDPNFTGKYHQEPWEADFTIEDGNLLIGFPFEEPVD